MRKRKQLQVELTLVKVPLPPERRWAYEQAWRILFDLVKQNAPQPAKDTGCAQVTENGD